MDQINYLNNYEVNLSTHLCIHPTNDFQVAYLGQGHGGKRASTACQTSQQLWLVPPGDSQALPGQRKDSSLSNMSWVDHVFFEWLFRQYQRKATRGCFLIGAQIISDDISIHVQSLSCKCLPLLISSLWKINVSLQAQECTLWLKVLVVQMQSGSAFRNPCWSDLGGSMLANHILAYNMCSHVTPSCHKRREHAPSFWQSCSLSSLNPLYVHCHCCSIMCYNICWYHTPHVVLLVNASKSGFCAVGLKSRFELEAASEGKILLALKSQKLNGRWYWGARWRWQLKNVFLKLKHYSKIPHIVFAASAFPLLFFCIKGQR